MALETNLEDSKNLKEFENLLKEDFKKRELKEGGIIKATVSEIGKKYIFVDLKAKSEGAIPIEEFRMTKELDALKVGSKIDVYLEAIESFRGELVVSREKARRMSSWKNMEKAFNDKKEVEGIITNRCKGGMIVNIESCLCFLPASLIDTRPLKGSEIDDLMNVPLKFMCVKLDEVRGNIVVSRRAVLEKTKSQDLKNILSKIKEGDIVEGKVKATLDWGAFIDLSGVDALLHCSDLSYSRVKKPSDLLSIGETIKVKIIKIDNETKRISCGIKQMHPDPYEGIEKKYKVGDIVAGTVTRNLEYGSFVRISDGLEGLVHSSELDWTKKNANPNKVLSPSQEIKVKIMEIDPEKRRISLSYKSTMENPWDKLIKENPVGSIVNTKVKNVTDFGIFLDIQNLNLSGLLHYKDISWEENEEELKKFKKGDNLNVKVLEIKKDEQKIRVGLKQLTKDPFDWFQGKNVNDIITVQVVSTDNKGLIVKPENCELEFLIKKSNIAINSSDARPSRFVGGERIDAAIAELNKDKRKVSLSIKLLEELQNKEAVSKFSSPLSGKNLPFSALSEKLDKKKDEDK